MLKMEITRFEDGRFLEYYLQFVEGRANISKDIIDATLGGNLRALCGVCLDDWLRVLVECDETLLDGLSVVVGSARGLRPLQHGLGQQVQHNSQGDEITLLHDGGQLLASLGARLNFLAEQIT